MNNKIRVKIFCKDLYNLNLFLINNNINFDYIYSSNNYQIINIDKNNYKKVRSKYKTRIVRYYGKLSIIKFIKKNYIFLFSLIWGIFLLILLSNTIFDIKIYTDNEDLKERLYRELSDLDIKKYSRCKSYEEIDMIKKKILKNNQDSLEWLEIRRNGTLYEVLLTERIVLKNNIDDLNPRHIVSKKDALIKHITSSSGEVIKDINDYVKKGEVIISGYIHKNDSVIKSVKSNGVVYGEVWYTVKTKVPYKYTEYVRNGKVINHYYIELFGNKMTLLGKYNTDLSMNSTVLLFDKPYLGFKLYKEKKELYDYKTFRLTEKEAYEEAIKRSDKSISNKLNKDEYVISKKVLNISPSSSKIEIEVFYKVYENITDTSIIEEKEE